MSALNADEEGKEELDLAMLQPDEETFQQREFQTIERLEDLMTNDKEIFIKIVSWLAPEVLCEQLDFDNLAPRVLHKINKAYQEKFHNVEKDQEQLKTGMQIPGLKKEPIGQKKLPQPSNSKLVTLCDYFLDRDTEDQKGKEKKNLFIMNCVFKITNRLDLLTLDQLVLVDEMLDSCAQGASSSVFHLTSDQRQDLKKLFACLMLSRPMMNTHQGLKNPGTNGTLFSDQVNIIQEFYATQKDVLNKFDKSDYDHLQTYIDRISKEQSKIECAL